MKILSLLLVWLWSSHSLAAPTLWSATKPGQQLWLFGSVHIADGRLDSLPAPLLQSLKQSERLFLEVDPATVTPAALAPFLSMPPGDSWHRRLGAPLANQLEQYFDQPALSLLKYLPPWFAVLQLTQARAMALGFAGAQGVDMQVMRMAQQQQLPISGLESPDLVFSLLASLPERQLEADFVRHTLDELDELQQHLERLLDTWQSGDEQALLALLHNEQSPTLSHFIEQELLLSRNRLWLKQLKSQSPKKALLVVGALHLYGEHGLLRLLEQDGYILHKVED
ncbi:TraB/GumN family protein [Oceanisphaera arctica]|uniref:TraB/GumN family protein n=1 Tax=Oceanisphaera arctica TaxID=641510 RepID=A0A2P5THW4_9GAMM|nr:TraB/GumN family protein [Oceanisphaera arctica]PPL14136.1 TraB/GumN family protein [Oceanisphaera arctica]GHA30250.1 conjugative transfer protein GumN [Oceanisphaera arctica]